MKSFYLRHVYGYRLRNIQNGEQMVFYTNIGSLWFNTHADAEKLAARKRKRTADRSKSPRRRIHLGIYGFRKCGRQNCFSQATPCRNRTSPRLAVQPRARQSNGLSGHIQRQPLPVVLHRRGKRCPLGSISTSCKTAGRKLFRIPCIKSRKGIAE